MHRSKHATLHSNLLRVALVFVTCGVAQLKEFGVVTNIVGGLAMCSLGFVFPPVMLMRLNSIEWVHSPGAVYDPQERARGSESGVCKAKPGQFMATCDPGAGRSGPKKSCR